MSHVIEFDPQEKIIRVTVHGELTDSGAAQLFTSVRAFLDSNEVRGGILDLSPVTGLGVALDNVRRLSKSPPLFKPPQTRVIVAPNDFIYGMARLFQISRSEIHSDLHVVRTLDEAYKIHGLEAPSFQVVVPGAFEAGKE